MQLRHVASGRKYSLSAMQTVGRDPSNNIVVPEPHVSREQCALQLHNGLLYVTVKPGSAQVVFVNGSLVQQQAVLNPGDHLTIGNTNFVVETESAQMHVTTAFTPQYAAQQASAVMAAPKQGPNALMWGLIGAVLACPLIAIVFWATIMLEYVMLIVGGVVLVWGFVERNQLRATGRMPTSSTNLKIFGGAIILLIGVVLVINDVQFRARRAEREVYNETPPIIIR